MALAPGLARKVKKVLETRADSPEIVACLRGLSEFYTENTPEARRGLRLSIERRGLDVNREFLDASSNARDALSEVDAQLDGLLAGCQRISSALDSSRARTRVLLRETSRLAEEKRAIEERKRTIKTFSVDFQLKDEEIALLKSDDVTGAFFDALARVQEIHANCRALLRTRHQRAGMELMDQMASHQEAAHERLCRWVQGECAALAEDDAGEVPELLSRAMSALRARPVLHKYCVEEVSRTRHNALFRRFINALTRGGPGGIPVPIETHAPDPLRYVGDMLGWLHQATAGEKELVDALLLAETPREGGGDGAETGGGDGPNAASPNAPSTPTPPEDEDDELADPAKVLDRILDGVCRPFKVRVEQVLSSTPPALVAFKLGNLLTFYRGVMVKIIGADAGLAATIDECGSSAKMTFESMIQKDADALRASPPVPTETLAAPAAVTEAANKAAELLTALSSTFDDGARGADGAEADASTADVLSAVIDPVIDACDRSADMIEAQVKRHRDAVAATGTELAPLPTAHAKRWAKEAYSINCAHAVAQVLTPFPRATSLVEKLTSKIAALTRKAAEDESTRVLHSAGLAEIRELMSLYQQQSGGGGGAGGSAQTQVMARDPALALDAVGRALDALVDAVSETTAPIPNFDEIKAPRIRADARAAFASAVTEAYTLVYMALLDPNNGYGRNAIDAMKHGPNALSTVLGGLY
ncbi:uncharacterized protein MICPUCDRAFT_34570 [Micromonas pusilla CCMP1545]|jgi:conserved oligomeric Golgi complex subunit 6|uniref:Conserved oligomeric Golgi complex subunit 6 n=1 Tax=Micromonas pusilla (strain CCMP1545) TaxID=564608 RepID=C1MX75_MICPC|nr:uncharacterized protein MICPUCDRAFT_34570 [Micromonas pusilla CCMP1545]EEH55413.1 predicted protein [Micromonas pusilla CCMP1545]|eukprot:XP_003060644.1 predicted protein [Micromonas pusilla CCMP1545]